MATGQTTWRPVLTLRGFTWELLIDMRTGCAYWFPGFLGTEPRDVCHLVSNTEARVCRF